MENLKTENLKTVKELLSKTDTGQLQRFIMDHDNLVTLSPVYLHRNHCINRIAVICDFENDDEFLGNILKVSVVISDKY